MKRLVKVLVATIVTLALLNGLALAAWSSAGAGAAAATASDMPPGNAPTISSTAGAVTVGWTESFIGTPPQAISTMAAGSYRVYRHTAAVGGDTSPFCEVAALSCGDTLEAGTYFFSVQPVLGNWTGQESGRVARTVVTDGADIAITFPADGATYSPASFLAGCGTTDRDACGSATAASETELTAVEASLHSTADDKYLDWTTSTFTSPGALYAPVSAGAWNLLIPELANGEYTLRLTATDNNGVGGGDSSTFTIDSTPPAQVPEVTLSTPQDGATFNTTQISYSGMAGVLEGDSTTVTVKLFEGTETGGTPLETRETFRETNGVWTVASELTLTAGTYTAQAQQENTPAGTGYSSANTFTITPPAVPPSLPSGVSASNPTATSLRLSWNDTSTTETKFVYQYSANSGPWLPADGVDVASTSQATSGEAYQSTVTGLACGTGYRFQIKAVDVTNNVASAYTSPTSAAATSTCPPPAAPTGLQAAAVGGKQINLTWTHSGSDATGYRVLVSTSGVTGSFSLLQTVAVGTTTLSHTGLSCANARWYQVQATSTATGQTSASSNTSTATTFACSSFYLESMSVVANEVGGNKGTDWLGVADFVVRNHASGNSGLQNGVNVHGYWSSAPGVPVQCTTAGNGGGAGRCSIESPALSRANDRTATFTFTGLSHASLTYDELSNNASGSLTATYPTP